MKLPDTISLYVNEIINQSRNGITITDPRLEDNPLIYVNRVFCTTFE